MSLAYPKYTARKRTSQVLRFFLFYDVPDLALGPHLARPVSRFSFGTGLITVMAGAEVGAAFWVVAFDGHVGVAKPDGFDVTGRFIADIHLKLL